MDRAGQLSKSHAAHAILSRVGHLRPSGQGVSERLERSHKRFSFIFGRPFGHDARTVDSAVFTQSREALTGAALAAKAALTGGTGNRLLDQVSAEGARRHRRRQQGGGGYGGGAASSGSLHASLTTTSASGSEYAVSVQPSFVSSVSSLGVDDAGVLQRAMMAAASSSGGVSGGSGSVTFDPTRNGW